ncbi:MAG: hypothetical protein ABS95_01290 [Verrucomicrobia bacterium SCN 57-15]|nr:MAG: hypothetical protein ABS95_01290 [Verrucomicrobia bacterium SCN 57-15]
MPLGRRKFGSKIADGGLHHLCRRKFWKNGYRVVAVTLAVRGAYNPKISPRVQADDNIGDCLGPAERAHNNFLVERVVSRRPGSQSNRLRVLAGVPGWKLERPRGIEGVAFASPPPLSFHGFEFGSVYQRCWLDALI